MSDASATIEKYLNKKYKLKTSDNFDEYLQFIGVGLISRKLIATLSPVSTLSKNEDGSYTMSVKTPIRDMVMTFKLGEEFIEERPDGVKVKSIFTIEEDCKLVQIQVESNGRTSKHVREFTDTILTVITTCEGWDGKCIRVYELIN